MHKKFGNTVTHLSEVTFSFSEHDLMEYSFVQNSNRFETVTLNIIHGITMNSVSNVGWGSAQMESAKPR